MPDVAIAFDNVMKSFAGNARQAALRDLSFSVARGEYVCIVGRTGCGKSTTVNLVLGLDRPDHGRISVLGVDPRGAFYSLRGRIGCVFQSDRLLPWRNIIDNVNVPVEIIGRAHLSNAPSAGDCLAEVGLSGYEKAYPHELSGGMRQRVALARAIVSNPDLLIADEAFGHLDEVTARTLRQSFKQIARAGGKTVLQITHSIDEAIELADRILVFGRPGHVVADLRVESPCSDGARERLRNTILRHIEGGALRAEEENLDRPKAAALRTAI
jgi:NitT/TauT family transport system ATP-binding protein